MVVVIKYEKLGECRYMSHRDVMRNLQRTVRRTGVDVCLSVGFNPHMLTYSSPPLPLGLESRAEYFAVIVESGEAEFIENFKRLSHPKMPVVASWIMAKNPNLAGSVTGASFECFTTSKHYENTSQKPKDIQEDFYSLIKTKQFVGEQLVDEYLDERNSSI